jgi:hypothetical protein
LCKVPLKRLAEELVRGLADRGIVRHDFVTTLLSEHLPAHPGYYGEMVWIMMMMEQWLRTHAKGFVKLSTESSSVILKPSPEGGRDEVCRGTCCGELSYAAAPLSG